MIPSPCIGSCRLDPAAQYCLGCARSGPEIAAWKDADPATRAATWADLPLRRAVLGIGLHRLAWTPLDTVRFAAAQLRVGMGSWAVAGAGPIGRFSPPADESRTVDRIDSVVTALTPGAAIRLTITDRVRALAVRPAGRAAREWIILAVPQVRTVAAAAERGVVPLGADHDAIRPADRAGRLYDLGSGPATGPRICLRTADPDLAAALDQRAGRPWGEVHADLAGQWARHPRTAVVVNPVGRVEVSAAGDWLAELAHRGPPAPADGFPFTEVPPAFVPCIGFDPAGGCIPQSPALTDRITPQPFGGP